MALRTRGVLLIVGLDVTYCALVAGHLLLGVLTSGIVVAIFILAPRL